MGGIVGEGRGDLIRRPAAASRPRRRCGRGATARWRGGEVERRGGRADCGTLAPFRDVPRWGSTHHRHRRRRGGVGAAALPRRTICVASRRGRHQTGWQGHTAGAGGRPLARRGAPSSPGKWILSREGRDGRGRSARRRPRRFLMTHGGRGGGGGLPCFPHTRPGWGRHGRHGRPACEWMDGGGALTRTPPPAAATAYPVTRLDPQMRHGHPGRERGGGGG